MAKLDESTARRKYDFAKPISYEVRPMELEEKSEERVKPAPILGIAPTLKEIPEKRPREKRAIWTVHGMGQQIPFETLDSVAEGILRQAESVPSHPPIKPRFRTVKIGDALLQRVEIDVVGTSGTEYELHLYEAYWAPVTEGVVLLRDAISFLLDGGIRGLLNSWKPFKRAIFGGIEEFQIPFRSPLAVILTLLVLGALTVINAIVLAASAVHTGVTVPQYLRMSAAQWILLTGIASYVSAIGITFGMNLFLAELSKPNDSSGFRRRTIQDLGWLSVSITAAAILAGAAMMAQAAFWPDSVAPALLAVVPELQGFSTLIILLAALVTILAVVMRGRLRSEGVAIGGQWQLFLLFAVGSILHLIAVALPFGLPNVIHFDPNTSFGRVLTSGMWVWPFLIVLSAQIRKLLVEYVGDLAAYITHNQLDRFQKIRSEIKEIARTSATAVYSALAQGRPHEFEYSKVAIVGHSLGSVIAYDTLNRLMIDDSQSGNTVKVAGRTAVFETFGSPLDKTAFFFTIQGSDSYEIREQLAESVQPMIQDSQYRQFPWINIYSKNDIISGSLDFYDVNGSGAMPVINIVDAAAIVPLAAHVEYWKNREVWSQLYSLISP